MPIVIVKIASDRGRELLPSTVMSVGAHSFLELFESTVSGRLNLSSDSIVNIKLRSAATSCPIHVSSVDMNVIDLIHELNCKFVEFNTRSNDYTPAITNTITNPSLAASTTSSSVCTTPSRPNAFSLLMENTYHVPTKPDSGRLTGMHLLKCDVIDLVSSMGCGWTKASIQSGEATINKLVAALWYVDHAHQTFKGQGCRIPNVFAKFNGYNNYKKVHHTMPVIKSIRLGELISDLATIVGLPSMTSTRNKKLTEHIESLMQCLAKYKNHLDKDNVSHKDIFQKAKTPLRNVNMDADLQFLSPKHKTKGDSTYSTLNQYLLRSNDYVFLDLDRFTPEDHVKRRNYIKSLTLSVPTMLYRVAYGGSVGTLNFIWRTPAEDTLNRTQSNSQVVGQITTMLPKYSTRAMRKDFINRYVKFVKAPKSVLRNMFFEISGCEPTSESKEQALIDERCSEILLNSDDSELILDYRSLNGKEGDTKFEVFYSEMAKYFEEQNLQVQERRHGNELYLPLAISIEDLQSQIKKRIPPNTPVPNVETIRLQFQPNNQFQKTALKYSGRFNVKFRVQTRQARVSHPDARFAATMYRYMKNFACRYRQHTTFVCMDDKAIIPVGEPGIPISTGVRGHNKVLTPGEGARLVATDHDFHIAGIVPSVALVSKIPFNPNDSFFKGEIHVTTKDKVFQASSPSRHTTELVKILRKEYSSNGIDLTTPILCLMTDGGPDHRVTYETVKLALCVIFMQLDLDMIVALRTAPNHSWMNPAERCMSILNLALQHVALARSEMPEQYEKAIKNKSSLGAVRNLADYKTGFKDAFQESIGTVLKTLNGRFKRMKLKQEPLRVYKGASIESINDCVEIIHEITGSKVSSNLNSAELRKPDMKGFQVYIHKIFKCITSIN